MIIPDPTDWNHLVTSGSEVPPWIVAHVAREALIDPRRGASWLNSLIVAPASPAITRAYLARELRQHLSFDAITALMTVLAESTSGWARLGACEALQGPWGEPARAALEAALTDTAELADMDYGFRVSDEAAIALHESGVSHQSAAFRAWRARTSDELLAANATRELAAIALAKLGDPSARRVLQELSSSSYQARDILERLNG